MPAARITRSRAFTVLAVLFVAMWVSGPVHAQQSVRSPESASGAATGAAGSAAGEPAATPPAADRSPASKKVETEAEKESKTYEEVRRRAAQQRKLNRATPRI